MSHMSVMRTMVDMKSTETLTMSLDQMKVLLENFTYSLSGNKITVRYKPIENYRKSGNLTFTRRGDVYEMVGDPYMCGSEFQKVTNMVEVLYRRNGVQTAMSRVGVPVQQKIKSGVRIMVTR